MRLLVWCGIVVSLVVLILIPVWYFLHVGVVVVYCYLVPREDGDPGNKADDPTQDRMVDNFKLSVVDQEQMVGFVTQRSPELDNIPELQWDIQHHALG